MPRVIQSRTFEYHAKCGNCTAKIGFTPKEVHAHTYKEIDGCTDTDYSIQCPQCGNKINLPWNYDRTLEKHPVSEG